MSGHLNTYQLPGTVWDDSGTDPERSSGEKAERESTEMGIRKITARNEAEDEI